MSSHTVSEKSIRHTSMGHYSLKTSVIAYSSSIDLILLNLVRSPDFLASSNSWTGPPRIFTTSWLSACASPDPLPPARHFVRTHKKAAPARKSSSCSRSGEGGWVAARRSPAREREMEAEMKAEEALPLLAA